ncbi:MAG: hypothetical protein ACO24B_08490 [Ilumatobacteraceae bacterium]
MKDYSVIDCTESALPYQPATLRDQFAMAALQAFCHEYVHDNSEDIADKCYTLADAMLKQRKK